MPRAPRASLPASGRLQPRAARSGQPGSLAPDPGGEAWILSGAGASYRVDIGPPDEQDSLLRVDGRLESAEGPGEWVPLVRAAGPLVRVGEGAVLAPTQLAEWLAFGGIVVEPGDGTLVLRYDERLDGTPLGRSLAIRTVGGSLELEVSADAGPCCGFSMGPLEADAGTVRVPGLPMPLCQPRPGHFLAGFADVAGGGASTYPPGGAFYRLDGEGRPRPVSERFYLTLSRDPLAVLPGLLHPPAPYRIALETRVAVDLYSDAPFREDERLLRLLPYYGLQDVVLLYRNWQHFGYRRRGPVHYPANLTRGKNFEFTRMLSRAAEAGWLAALLEDYTVVAPESPYFSETVVARWPDGLPQRSPTDGGFAVAADRMIEFARLEATQIQRNYPVSACFVDRHTAFTPSGQGQVDSARGQTEADAAREVAALGSFLREIHTGPLVGSAGEGPQRWDTLSAGMTEAVVRGPEGGPAAPLLVDYELEEVRPRLIGYGAGTYRQFCGLAPHQPLDSGQIDWDAYRAVELALGHAGYVGTWRQRQGPPGRLRPPFPGGSARIAVREYFLLRGVQELLLKGRLHEVHYFDGEHPLSLAESLTECIDLTRPRIRVRFADGLELWVNRGETSWRVEAGGEEYELPENGFLAFAADQHLLAYSAELPGGRADFCRCRHYLFADVRSPSLRRVEEFSTDGAAAFLPGAVTGRPDVVLVEAQQLVRGEHEYRLSERADVRITHLSPREVEVTVMDSESGKPIHVHWPAFTNAWHAPGLEVVESEGDGEWIPSRALAQPTRTGPQLSRARPGVSYRVTAR